jgi:pimeloyl-ACP methyl ester carboxylesterase
VLGVADRQVYIAGTSYGGFVAYNMARSLGPERVKRVVIASSDLLKSEDDDKELIARVGVDNLVDLMLPKNTKTLKSLLGLTTYRAPKFMPEFLLRDIMRVHLNFS